ncbi:RNA polymerase sigma factor [Microbacterium sp. NPDC058389]|uniref:RNA polymerase sigma factor n=1 Tax=Microbacterium sp. NPDC058389 TaxID=3346475 RepID=UPI00365980AB
MDAVTPPSAAGDVDTALTRAHRAEWAAVVASTARLTGDLDLAEECAQEAFARAVEVWPVRGIPDRPGAWLTTVAANRARDELRRRTALRRRLPLLVREDPPDDDACWHADDRLRLVFTCCHPALSREAQVGLTLRLVCGVSTGDVAAVLLVSEPTMAARITRAKRKIAVARIPFRVPDAAELPARIDVVCDVLYLVFTVGHAPPSGEARVRADLVDEAIALTRMLHGMLPKSRAVTGLLALMLLIDARRGTRDELLPDQDRSRWDRALIDEGLALLAAATTGAADRYAISAAIAAAHAQAPTWRGTDWARIVELYGLLGLAWPSPVVTLNRAVALGMRDGPAAGLAAVDAVSADPALSRYPYLPAARAAFLGELGRWDEAADAYAAAAVLAGSTAERERLRGQTADARLRAAVDNSEGGEAGPVTVDG